MIIKDIMESKIFDENEQIVILEGYVDNPKRLYTGRLRRIPEELHELKVELIASMGERRRNEWNLNKYGWLEIWID